MYKAESALLLTEVESYERVVRKCADAMRVSLTVESVWNKNYRITESMVLAGSKYLANINPEYYRSVTVILKPDEEPFGFMKKGIRRFIYRYDDEREIKASFFLENVEAEHPKGSTNGELKEIIRQCPSGIFDCGQYCFDFVKGIFIYSGDRIYLSSGERCYLAKWLLKGSKDNSRRIMIYNMRQRFGKDFLKDVDRVGKLKEHKNER